jgi:uroporphyrinogen III methyltransferase/synthase
VRARGKVFLVGAGPGDPGLLTLKGARALATCDALVYDNLVAAPIVALAPPAAEKIYAGKRAGDHTLKQDEINALLIRLATEGKRVVRLKGGDVFVFARGGEEASALREAGIPFEIVPGITSALAAPAYAGIPLTHRAHVTSFVVATGHEDPLKGASSLDFAKLANPAQTRVFGMAMQNLASIVAQLRAHGMPGDMPVAIVRDGTKPEQTTLVSTLEHIVEEVERTRMSAPAIVVIGTVVTERERIRWFDTGPLFGKRVLVTRPAGSADTFAALLREAGAEPLKAPTIAINPPADERAADDGVRYVRAYQWIVFTSVNGVSSFFERLRAQGGDARRLGDVNVAAIGPKTAATLGEHGVRADFVPARYVAEEVAGGLLERTQPGDRILLYRAQEARDVLPVRLRAAARFVDDVAAYATVFTEDPSIAAAAEAADVWTFTSSKTVEGFIANVPDAARLRGHKIVACIGPITADTARLNGLTPDIVAEEYTVEGLCEALELAAVS